MSKRTNINVGSTVTIVKELTQDAIIKIRRERREKKLKLIDRRTAKTEQNIERLVELTKTI